MPRSPRSPHGTPRRARREPRSWRRRRGGVASSNKRTRSHAGAASLVPDDHRPALAQLETAGAALADGRLGEAERLFGEAARAFRAAAKSAARERTRAGCLAARKDAEAARERATKAGAAELA